MITMAEPNSKVVDMLLEYAGIDDEEPEGVGPEAVEPMFTVTVVLCEIEPLVSVTVTV